MEVYKKVLKVFLRNTHSLSFFSQKRFKNLEELMQYDVPHGIHLSGMKQRPISTLLIHLANQNESLKFLKV